MICYRLYTENVDGAPEKVIRCLLANGFPGATLQGGIGVWEGYTEKSLVIEIVLPENPDGEQREMIQALAESIRVELNQFAVAVASYPVEWYTVTGAKREAINGGEVIDV